MAEKKNIVAQLHSAIEAGDVDTATAVLATASNLAQSIVNAVSESGYTALYHACMRRSKMELIQVILRASPAVDTKGDDRETALYIAVHNNLVHVVPLLLRAGAQVNELNGVDSETALHAAARFGFVEIAESLVHAGANINMRNVRMETPLFVAAKYGKLDSVAFLLGIDANRNLANEDGKNPLYIASERGHKFVVMLLKVEKAYLRDVKAQIDVELRSQPQPLPTTERLASHAPASETTDRTRKPSLESFRSKQASAQGQPRKEEPLTPFEITKIEIPEYVERTHDPLTGKAYGPCKTLEQAGYQSQPVIPSEVQLAPLVEERIGGTSMAVGTGTGIIMQTPPLLSQLPDADVVDYGSSIVIKKR